MVNEYNGRSILYGYEYAAKGVFITEHNTESLL